MKKTLARLLLALAVLPLLAACTYISVQNQTGLPVRVRIHPPDSFNASSSVIPAQGSTDFFTSYGGFYSVELVPSAEYEAALRQLQDEISAQLFNPSAQLNAAEVQALSDQLTALDGLIASLADPMPSCTGSVPDFETTAVTISSDPATSALILTCE